MNACIGLAQQVFLGRLTSKEDSKAYIMMLLSSRYYLDIVFSGGTFNILDKHLTQCKYKGMTENTDFYHVDVDDISSMSIEKRYEWFIKACFVHSANTTKDYFSLKLIGLGFSLYFRVSNVIKCKSNKLYLSTTVTPYVMPLRRVYTRGILPNIQFFLYNKTSDGRLIDALSNTMYPYDIYESLPHCDYVIGSDEVEYTQNSKYLKNLPFDYVNTFYHLVPDYNREDREHTIRLNQAIPPLSENEVDKLCNRLSRETKLVGSRSKSAIKLKEDMNASKNRYIVNTSFIDFGSTRNIRFLAVTQSIYRSINVR